jgi:hypothetical protein
MSVPPERVTHFTGLQVGAYPGEPGTAGSNIFGIRAVTVSVDPPSVAANGEASQNVTVAGLAVGDAILCLQPPAPTNAGLYLRSYTITGANTLQLTWRNETASAIDAAAFNMLIVWVDLTP